MSRDEYCVRKFQVYRDNNEYELRLHQKQFGDVNCIVWDSALALAKHLELKQSKDETFLTGKSVLELGSGVGCVGLTAAVLGANVTLTDLPEAIHITQHNIEDNKHVIRANGGTASAKILNWSEEMDDNFAQSFHFVVLSDCVYYEASVMPLIRTLIQIGKACKTTTILQSQEIRNFEKHTAIWENYFEEIREHFHVKEISAKEQHVDYICNDIKIYKLVYISH